MLSTASGEQRTHILAGCCRKHLSSCKRNSAGHQRTLRACSHLSFADRQKTVTPAQVEGVAHEFELDNAGSAAPVSTEPENLENLLSVEKVLRDLSTVLERMRQPASFAVGSGKEAGCRIRSRTVDKSRNTF